MNKVIEQLMKDKPGTTNFSAKVIKEAAKSVGKSPESSYQSILYTHNCPRVSHGVYNLESMMPKSAVPKKTPSAEMIKGVSSVSYDEVFVPNYDPTFVLW